jgi:polyisoprenoid-binding protein YceI
MKIKNLMKCVLLAGALVSAPLMAANYMIDKPGQHAFITFKVGHLGYSYIVGGFNDFKGTFNHDAKNPGDSKVNVVINTQSIDTNHAERDKHLRSADFLDVSVHPKITFDSTGYVAGANGDTLKGNMTIHGVTKPIEIKVKHLGEGDDPWGGYRSGFVGSVTLNSADFGMPDWVGDLEIELNIEGTQL